MPRLFAFNEVAQQQTDSGVAVSPEIAYLDGKVYCTWLGAPPPPNPSYAWSLWHGVGDPGGLNFQVTELLNVDPAYVTANFHLIVGSKIYYFFSIFENKFPNPHESNLYLGESDLDGSNFSTTLLDGPVVSFDEQLGARGMVYQGGKLYYVWRRGFSPYLTYTGYSNLDGSGFTQRAYAAAAGEGEFRHRCTIDSNYFYVACAQGFVYDADTVVYRQNLSGGPETKILDTDSVPNESWPYIQAYDGTVYMCWTRSVPDPALVIGSFAPDGSGFTEQMHVLDRPIEKPYILVSGSKIRYVVSKLGVGIGGEGTLVYAESDLSGGSFSYEDYDVDGTPSSPAMVLSGLKSHLFWSSKPGFSPPLHPFEMFVGLVSSLVRTAVVD